MAIFYTDSGSFNDLEVTGSTILSGSLIVSGTTNFGPTGLTGSLFGSSSFATTASAATSITFTPLSASFAETSSAATSITFVPESSSYALTASYAANGGGANLTTITIPLVDAIINSNYSLIITSGSQHLQNGTYAVTGVVSDTFGLYYKNYAISGIISWITSSNSIIIDEPTPKEIFLSKTGGVYGGNDIFMRTRIESASVPSVYLEIASTINTNINSDFTFVKLL